MIDVSEWLGEPYSGRRGCAVLVAKVLAHHGIPYADVDRPEDAHDWTRVDVPRPLDAVVFNERGVPSHVGLCIGGGRFFHVDIGMTARIERLTSPLWQCRIEGFYRYTGT